MSNKRIRNPKLKPWLRGWDWTELTHVYGKDDDELFPELQWKKGSDIDIDAREEAVATWLKEQMESTMNVVMTEHYIDRQKYNEAKLAAWKIRHYLRRLSNSKYSCDAPIWKGISKIPDDWTMIRWMIRFLECAWD